MTTTMTTITTESGSPAVVVNMTPLKGPITMLKADAFTRFLTAPKLGRALFHIVGAK